MLLRYNQAALEKDSAVNGNRPYQQCKISVLDTIADFDIQFDQEGICNYYYEYLEAEKQSVLKGEEGAKTLEKIVTQIKETGKNNRYDCILGVSGGVDSTYLAYVAKQLGLRVLCVHFDNGWNSELAVMNIENIVNKLEFDLYTYVINWEEFRDIQLAYFKANVIDIEAATDIAIFTALDRICSEQGIRYVIDGRNVVTEEVLPKSWICKDPQNLLNIHAKHGTIPLRTYPIMSDFNRAKRQLKKPFESVKILNYIPYDKKQAKATIIKELSWRDYGGKHYESVFTRFYQGYILPHKFFVDKRKAHLSNLIFSGQINKEEALVELAQPIYKTEQLQEDYDFALKKLGFSEQEFEAYIMALAVPHAEYGFSKNIYERYPYLKLVRPFYKTLKKILHK